MTSTSIPRQILAADPAWQTLMQMARDTRPSPIRGAALLIALKALSETLIDDTALAERVEQHFATRLADGGPKPTERLL